MASQNIGPVTSEPATPAASDARERMSRRPVLPNPPLGSGTVTVCWAISSYPPRHGFFDLNVHTLWTLLAARPSLLRASSAAGRALRERLPVMLDDAQLSPQARRELEGIRYAIRLAEA
ncbi:hypothetical protein [Streptomyces griseochromogenes]|uniref:hypothetical protein n=1 Tax=Streptomyces griseochromogenes TaxID=68214 RepID=UPI0037A0557E